MDIKGIQGVASESVRLKGRKPPVGAWALRAGVVGAEPIVGVYDAVAMARRGGPEGNSQTADPEGASAAAGKKKGPGSPPTGRITYKKVKSPPTKKKSLKAIKMYEKYEKCPTREKGKKGKKDRGVM